MPRRLNSGYLHRCCVCVWDNKEKQSAHHFKVVNNACHIDSARLVFATWANEWGCMSSAVKRFIKYKYFQTKHRSLFIYIWCVVVVVIIFVAIPCSCCCTEWFGLSSVQLTCCLCSNTSFFLFNEFIVCLLKVRSLQCWNFYRFEKLFSEWTPCNYHFKCVYILHAFFVSIWP